MQLSQDVLIPVYSTSTSLYHEVFQWGLVGTVVIFLAITAIGAALDLSMQVDTFAKILITALSAMTICFTGLVLTGVSPASENNAYYIAINGGATSKGYDVKHEDVNKAIKAKYDLSTSKRSSATYEDGHGAIYHDCRVSFTKPVNNHIAIESMNCSKGENLTPVKVK